MVFHGLLDRELAEVIELFVDSAEAHAMLADIVIDEPDWGGRFEVVVVDFRGSAPTVMRTYVPVTAEGSALTRFRRAIEQGSPTLALAAAAELPPLALDNALRLLLVLRYDDPNRFARAVARWHGRWVAETRSATAVESALVLASLSALRDPSVDAAVQALTAVFERHRQHALASALPPQKCVP